MSPSPVSLADLIAGARRIVRRDATMAVAGAALLVVPFVMVMAWLLAGGNGWIAPSPGPLALELAGAALATTLFLFLRRRWLFGTDERDLAATAESGAGLPAGAVLGVLELGRGVPRGTSSALFHREAASVSGHFTGRTSSQVTGEVGRVARRRRGGLLGGLLLLTGFTGILGFASPERALNGWSPLLHPLAHLSSDPLPAMQVRPGDTEILRGSDLAVRIDAPGRFAVTLSWRAEGDVLHRQTVSVTGDTAVAVVQRIDARTEYWIDAPDGARTRNYVITPIDPLLVTDLTVVVRYPAHVGRAPDRYSTEVPPLELPEGSTLLIDGRATRVLAKAGLQSDKGAVELTITEDGFSGSWTPSVGGVYEWQMRGADGSDLLTAPVPLEIVLMPDVPPVVEVTYPGRDTLVDPTRIHTIAGDARDDFGVASAALVSWRISAGGKADPPSEVAVPIENGSDRVLVRGVLDLRERDLLPGDTIKYYIKVTDNSPRAQTGVSTTYALYIPGAGDLRDRVTEEAEDLVRRAEELARNTKTLNEETRTLQRRTEASNSRRNDPASRTSSGNDASAGRKTPLGFREAEQAKQILEQQQKVMAGLEEMRDRLEKAQRAMEDAGLRDPSTEQKLKELRQQYEQMMTPEMQKQMDALKEALDKLDPEQLQKALEQLAERQKELQKQLEESLEQLERAADEQRTSALAQETRELATQQQALAESLKDRTPTQQDAGTQKDLEQKARDLAAQIQELGKDLEQHKTQEAADQAKQAAQQVNDARKDMNQAADRAQSKQGQDAAQSAQQAANQLEQAAKTLDNAKDQLGDASQRAMQQALEQATSEALSLAERQADLKDRMEQMQKQQGQQQQGQQQQGQQQQGQQQQGQQQQGGQQTGQQQGQQQQGGQGGQQQQGQQQGGQQAGDLQRMREEQSALQQGLEQLGRNLSQASQQAGQMNKDVGSALGRANMSMQQTMQALQQSQNGQPMPSQQAGQTVEALNRLALSLLNQQQNQQQSQSGSEQAMQQLSDIAQQQGQLNGRSNALVPMNLPQQNMSQQVNRMAQDQRQIAAQLEDVNKKIGGREDVLGKIDELAAEAERLAREMEGGRLPADVLARQERLFHRLLDAGRSLERDETSSERVAERPGQYIPISPPPLDAALLDSSVRYRVPTPEELKNMPPAYRKMVLDYFERINKAQAGQVKKNE